ncbi:hypothetical protein [Nonomuraea sp. NPDC049158]|uniref:hypothetical protein n=1 Tax=Nonomuraea sp. NPDC049158 TaxID=3155649 RepID=UPI00340154F7
MTKRGEPASDGQVPVLGDNAVLHAWRHCPGRVRTSLEEFLAVSGLSDREQHLLRGHYRWDDSEA